MKRSLFILAVLCLALLVASQAFATGKKEGAAPKVERFAFSTSNVGGTWYTMAGGITTLFNEKLGDRYMLDFVASGGSVENTRRLALGEADMALSYGYHLYEAQKGTGILEGKPSNKGTIMFEIYDSSIYFVATKASGITKMSDVQGKRVVLGPPGSGSSDNSRRVLQSLGIKVIEQELAFADGARAIQDGQADVLGMSGHPSSGIVELANTRDIIVIPFSNEEMDRIVRETPFFTRGQIQANVYKGQTQVVQCPYFVVYLAASKDMSADAVYQAMKVFFSDEGKAKLISVHSQFKPMREGKEGAAQIGIPFHPGAVKFWNEKK
ncbi:MAG: TAXI family TRAP transporter solute-binding subunit [Spirochaetaceae bacterium]|nr:TAXI family TRAP transporter solute-binding subunit [Spirochaetaceae bacterium]